jgi:hypothetical protein
MLPAPQRASGTDLTDLSSRVAPPRCAGHVRNG